MKKIFLIFFPIIFLMAFSNTFSQTKINKKNFIGNNYWTKFVLATESNCKVEITPNDISPSQESCGFKSHLKTGAKLKLKDLSDEKDWAKLIFETGDKKEFEVFLKNDSKTNFRKSFNLAFSRKKTVDDDFYPYEGKLDTKINVIKNLGFPTSIDRNNKEEKWTFSYDWIYWEFYNFDVTYIDIEDDKVIKISGLV